MHDWTESMHDIYEILPFENKARSPPGLTAYQTHVKYCEKKEVAINSFRGSSSMPRTVVSLEELEKRGWVKSVRAPHYNEGHAAEGKMRTYYFKKIKGKRNPIKRETATSLDTIPSLAPAIQKVA